MVDAKTIHIIDQITAAMREIFKEDGYETTVSIAENNHKGELQFTIEGVYATNEMISSVIRRAANRIGEKCE